MALDRKSCMDQADRLVAKGQVDKALLEYKKLTAAFPGDGTLLNRLGDLCIQAGKPVEAAAAFQSAAQQLGLTLP